MPAAEDPAAGAERRESFVGGNVYDKYRTKNPLYRRLMARFLADARELLGSEPLGRVVEVGCGPGDLAAALLSPLAAGHYTGLDLDLSEVRRARLATGERFVAGSAFALPFPDCSAETVIACEVLEHLERPELALAEIRRIAAGRILLSVPWEPTWRLLNLARGAYWSRLGNTPGHLQNFSRRRFRELVSTLLVPIAERRPFPWTMILARVREP